MISPRTIVTLLLGFWLGGCATVPSGLDKSAANKPNLRRLKVRTTAYTHTERGGRNNALGVRLSGSKAQSASCDWSRYPLGTRFRIAGTNEEFIVDDYGGALVDTNTIDLYKTNALAMQQWGVRNIDIDILEWGSEERSIKVLAPRSHNRYVQRMVASLQKKKKKRS